MIISRSPLRISFIGGGTDNVEFINKFGSGCVLGTSINRYVYVFIDAQPSFEKNRFKFTYRNVEEVDSPKEFKHPVVRAMLQDLKIIQPLNIATMANLPGRSGLGSSSAFTVSLYSALMHLKRTKVEPEEIAKYAIYCERNLMQEAGGFQDQYHAALGGFRSYFFNKDQVKVSSNILSEETEKYLNKSILLVATIKSRDSKYHAEAWNQKVQVTEDPRTLLEMRDLCVSICSEIQKLKNPKQILKILIEGTREGWKKKSEHLRDINPEVHEIIEHGLRNGAAAAKLCGAGGSGFVMFLASPEKMAMLQSSFPSSQIVRPEIEKSGVKVYEI